MKDEMQHISSYASLTVVLIILLTLTTISVLITGIHLGPVTVAVALVIASVKVAIVITQFMHLRFENLFLKLAVSGVFTLFALVILITFIDYFFR
ncbi:MAG: cytochrome C oxidase subunit IV family protein [Bacteroidota bacterium]|nr:cytochrome C oxidase subunit IV family protein [Bacteroidota bacterium]